MKNIVRRLKSRQLTIYKTSCLILLNFLIHCLFIGFSFGSTIALSDYEKNIKNNFGLKNAADKLSQRDLEKMLRHFVSNSRPNRVTGSSGSRKAQLYIHDFLKDNQGANVSVTKQDFTFNEEGHNLQGANYIWSKKGVSSGSQRLILMAHFDTLLIENNKRITTGEMQGADNNASSVSLLFGVIALLNKLDLPKTVEVVFLDAHEWNGAGVKKYLSTNKINTQTDFIINLSKLGHDSKKEDKLSRFMNISLYLSSESTKNEQEFGERFIASANRNFPQLMITLKQQSKAQREDPVDFLWREKLPGVMLSQDRENDLNPRLYTSNDFVETLNFDTLFFIYKALVSSVLALNYDIVK